MKICVKTKVKREKKKKEDKVKKKKGEDKDKEEETGDKNKNKNKNKGKDRVCEDVCICLRWGVRVGGVGCNEKKWYGLHGIFRCPFPCCGVMLNDIIL